MGTVGLIYLLSDPVWQPLDNDAAISLRCVVYRTRNNKPFYTKPQLSSFSDLALWLANISKGITVSLGKMGPGGSLLTLLLPLCVSQVRHAVKTCLRLDIFPRVPSKVVFLSLLSPWLSCPLLILLSWQRLLSFQQTTACSQPKQDYHNEIPVKGCTTEQRQSNVFQSITQTCCWI